MADSAAANNYHEAMTSHGAGNRSMAMYVPISSQRCALKRAAIRRSARTMEVPILLYCVASSIHNITAVSDSVQQRFMAHTYGRLYTAIASDQRDCDARKT
jgi:hypothetical protein